MAKEPVPPPEEDEDDRPIKKLHIPYDMVIDPDRPQKLPRPKPDPLTLMLQTLALMSALFLVASLLFVIRAIPPGVNIFVQMLGQPPDTTWNASFLHLGLYMSVPAVVMSISGEVLSLVRKARVYIPLLVTGLLSTAVLISLAIVW